jgi:hypothetical protein
MSGNMIDKIIACIAKAIGWLTTIKMVLFVINTIQQSTGIQPFIGF